LPNELALEILDRIEEFESKLVNFGIYETSVTLQEVLEWFDQKASTSDVENGLEQLRKEKRIIRLKNNVYRSRIGEIIRLLYNLKQRFPDVSAMEAPRLVRSLKFKIVKRLQPARTEDLGVVLDGLDPELQFMPEEEIVPWKKSKKIIVETMISLIKDFRVSRFQQRAITRILSACLKRAQKGFVLSAETGSGKTEGFLIPILLYSMIQKGFLKRSGTKAIIIYPRIKLAENQLMRMVKYLSLINPQLDSKITVGIDYEKVPWETSKIAEKWYKDDDIVLPMFACPFCEERLTINQRELNLRGKVIVECRNKKCEYENLSENQLRLDFLLLSKDKLAQSPPDILIITTESLHRRLMDAQFRKIFGDSLDLSTPTIVVLDEIHLYKSLHGSQIALLVRRLKKRLEDNLKDGYPLIIGASATISNCEDFWSRMSGIPRHLVEEIAPDASEKREAGKEYYIFAKPEKFSRGKYVQTLATMIQTVMCLLHNVMRRPDKYKGLGFIDSVDTLRRWRHAQTDAEQRKLFDLRVSKNKCGFTEADCNPTACPTFDDGECWWFARHDGQQFFIDGVGSFPLKIAIKWSGSDDDETLLTNDLILSTSSMEVGFDDPEMQVIFQYKSPLSPVSFAQRKGRGG